MSAPIQGSIFSSSVPGRKPMSSPSGIVTRVMMISAKRFDSSVCMSPAASVSSVLPVPAGPEDGDEVDLRIHEQVEREILLAVARVHAPDAVALAAEIARELERGGAGFDAPHDGLDACFAGLVHELVDVQVGDHRARRPGRKCARLPSRTCMSLPAFSQKSAGSAASPVYSTSASSMVLSL